jgi:hypothetical protein
MSGDGYLALFEDLYQRHAERGGDRVRLLLSPSNVQWASDALFQRIKALAARYGVGIHMHLAETPYQKGYAARRFGKSAVAHLSELGPRPELSCPRHLADDEDLSSWPPPAPSSATTWLELGCRVACG